MNIDYELDVSQFVCRCWFLASLRNTLNEINFLEHGLSCELVILDMGNYVSPWTELDIMDLFCLLGTNRDIFTCIFISDFQIAYLVDKVVTLLSSKSKRHV